MAIYKRKGVYWFHFVWNGKHIQKSTRQGNGKIARQIENAYRTQLALAERGLAPHPDADPEPAPEPELEKAVPTFQEFAPRFIERIEVECADKPMTILFYKQKLKRLLEYGPLASVHLNAIDEALIDQYVQKRRKQVSPASVNRELATLRRLLRVALRWKEITSVPIIEMLDGERIREFVLSHDRERDYLDFAPQPLKDVARLILDTGLRVGEAVALERDDIILTPLAGARYGHLKVRKGKSKNAKRVVSLTPRVRDMLQTRLAASASKWVFPGDGNNHFLETSLNHQHVKVRRLLGMPEDFVIHSLRHTMLTRLGEAGVDAFTIMKIAGHSSIEVSQRYVHPTPEGLERAFERLEALNAMGGRSLDRELPVATFSATLDDSASDDAPDKSPVSVS